MKSRVLTITVRAVILAVVVALIFSFARVVQENESIRNLINSYGYVGVFVISLISGFNLVVPIPAASFLPVFLEAGLKYPVTILLITLGMTMADSIAYFVGGVGKDVLSQSPAAERRVARLIKIRDQHSWIPLAFLFIFASIAPVPNEVLLVPFAFLGYRYLYIIPIVFAGNLIFNVLYSAGVINLFRLI